jgi:hypothetical protein
MKNNIIIEEEILQGEPLKLERALIMETINALQQINGSNYEDTCHNLRLIADVIEEIEEHINDDLITFKWNPMGAWYRVENEEEEN